MGPSIRNLKIPIWAPQPCVEASVKIVNSAWKGQIGIPEVRKVGRASACVGWQGLMGLIDAGV